ncbi:hypothetical protein GQX73_g7430 [Xylaria multiplex]|uniref:Methylated-DNA-[protein]-cysteine S-methyltransferase DNA binding domain-containing protein n=1 Tax=Xylaria multiplex TaxID=323545 RepID=A0A7C8MPD7_9PEZI|nr:hypothetical protein GQX73_g7430 [Xylaria multiplex]
MEELPLTTKRIYIAIQKIPKGKVSSYKDIVASSGIVGRYSAVQDVIRVIRELPENPRQEFNTSNVPWHRVITEPGEIPSTRPFGVDVQLARRKLEEEGHHLRSGSLMVGGGLRKWHLYEGEHAGGSQSFQTKAHRLQVREQVQERAVARELAQVRAQVAQEHEILAREQEILAREREIIAREQEILAREREVGAREREVGAREREVGAREREVGAREREVGLRARELAREVRAQTQPRPQRLDFGQSQHWGLLQAELEDWCSNPQTGDIGQLQVGSPGQPQTKLQYQYLEPQTEDIEQPQAKSPEPPQTKDTEQVKSPEPQAESPQQPQAENLEQPRAEDTKQPQVESPEQSQTEDTERPQVGSPEQLQTELPYWYSEPQTEDTEQLQVESPEPQVESPQQPQAESTEPLQDRDVQSPHDLLADIMRAWDQKQA